MNTLSAMLSDAGTRTKVQIMILTAALVLLTYIAVHKSHHRGPPRAVDDDTLYTDLGPAETAHLPAELRVRPTPDQAQFRANQQATRVRMPAELLLEARRRAARTRVVFAGLVHNGAGELPFVIHALNATCRHFHACAFAVFENDSTDQTPAILHAWQRVDARVHVVTEQLNRTSALAARKAGKRTLWMAEYRERLRHIVMDDTRFGDFDLVAFVDMDMYNGWSPEHVVSSLVPPDSVQGWDAVCAHGIDSGMRLYDAFAFRSAEFPLGSDPLGAGVKRYWHEYVFRVAAQRFDIAFRWVRAYSCFGGLALFHRHTLARTGCGYADPRVSVDDCEHVRLYDCLARQGHDRVWMNLNMVMRYHDWHDGRLGLVNHTD